MPIAIRPATLADLLPYRDLALTSFAEKWADNYSTEDMAAYNEQTFSEARTIQDLQDAAIQIYIAWQGEEAVGYSKLSVKPNAEAPPAANPIELERLYLRESVKGQGIGSLLLQHAIDMARAAGHDVLWLGVWENNTAAMGIYRKFGFVQYGEHPYAVGAQVDTDLLMKLEL